jgi:hypothetical protein
LEKRAISWIGVAGRWVSQIFEQLIEVT